VRKLNNETHPDGAEGDSRGFRRWGGEKIGTWEGGIGGQRKEGSVRRLGVNYGVKRIF